MIFSVSLDGLASTWPPTATSWRLDTSSLAPHGWIETTKSPVQANVRLLNAISTVLKDLKISTAPEDNTQHAFAHQKQSTHAGHNYPPTNASYSNDLKIAAGAIIADANTPPRSPSDDALPLSQYPAIVFPAWHSAAGPNAKTLNTSSAAVSRTP